MQWKCLAGYGKTLSAMKAFPTDSYADAENGAPYIEYSIVTKQAGDYEAEFYMQPSNPVTTENRLQYAVSVNGVPMQILDAVTDDFKIARCAGSDPVPECTGATGTGNQYDQGLSGHAGLCA